MNELEAQRLLTQIFNRLRSAGFTLGLGELFAVRQAVEGGWGRDDLEELRQVAALLWCHSREELLWFNIIWAEETRLMPSTASPSSSGASIDAAEKEQFGEPVPQSHPINETENASPNETSNFASLPVRAPKLTSLSENRADLHTYWPISRRVMVYSWRYLRRPVPGGPMDVLDIPATVQRVTQQGFFLAPVYRQRERNDAHLVLLVDQYGSMMPFHRFTRDMIETVRDESSIEQVDTYYFHNLMTDQVSLDPYLTMKMPWEKTLAQLRPDTSVLVVSDAGAARGYRNENRIRETTRFLSRLRKCTNLIAWLNPMPMERWSRTSAQIIAHLVPMFQMDQDGFSNAIDVVRGGPLHHSHTHISRSR